MELEEYRKMHDLEDHHWWFQSRLALTRRILDRALPPVEGRKPRLLDMGCGTGMFLQRQNSDREIYGLDFSREALSFTRGRGVERLVCADSQRLPFASASFDAVTAFDLIEHVEGDDLLIAEVNRILRPGGILLATVPAHPFLWSDHDVALHHQRRYRMNEFKRLFDASLWNEKRLTYSFCAIFPPAAVVRTLMRSIASDDRDASADTRPTPAWLNGLMMGVHRVENAWLERFDAPMGLSIMTVQEKRA